MTLIKKLAWYGSSVAFAALLAVALLVTGPASVANAADATVTVTTGTVGGTAATVAVADADLTAGEIVIFTIIGGTGAGNFTSNGGQTLACADDASGGSITTCDRNTAAGTVTVQLTGTTAGSLLVRTEIYDGADGAGATGLPTANINGSYLISTVTVNNPVASISLSRTPTTIAAAAGTSTVTATVKDSGGANVVNGTQVTFQTTHGTFTDGCQTGTNTQVCVARVNTADGTEAGEVAGTAVVVLTAGGLTGTATITSTVGSVSSTTTVTLSGTTNTVTVSTQVDADGAGTGTTGTASSTPNATTLSTGAGFWVQAILKDSSDNIVAGVTPTIASTTSGVTFGACTASAATTGISTCAVTAVPAAGTTVNYTVTVGTKTGTGSFTVGGSTTATVEVTAADIELTTLGEVTASLKDSSGRPIGDNTSVTLVVTAGALVSNTALTRDGVATFQYVSPGTAQTVNATALAGGKTGSATFNVGPITPPPAGAGSFAGDIAPSGVSTVTFEGGDLASLAAAAEAVGATSVSVFIGGMSYTHIVGAPAFVNAAFAAQFPDGVPANQIVLLAIVN